MIMTLAFISGVIRGLLRITSRTSEQEEANHAPAAEAAPLKGRIDLPAESAQDDVEPAAVVLAPPEPRVEEPAVGQPERRGRAEIGEVRPSRDQEPPASSEPTPERPSETRSPTQELASAVSAEPRAALEQTPIIGAESQEPVPVSEAELATQQPEPPLLLTGPESQPDERVSKIDEPSEAPTEGHRNDSAARRKRRANRRRRAA